MDNWTGYKGNRKSITQRVHDDRLKGVKAMDIPLLWLPSWEVQLTAAQRYRLQRGLL